MPGRDGTGPMGAGSMTGRGLGLCAGGAVGYGTGRGPGLGLGWRRGLGCGRGFGRQFAPAQWPDDVSQKDLLAQQKRALEDRLEVVNRQLESM